MSPTRFRRLVLALTLALALPAAQAQPVGTAFTYQGELRASGTPANAAYDFQFRLFSAPSGGTQIGPQVAANAVTVTSGLFTVPLDFGPAQFAGDAQWLEISVRPATGGAFETLLPRTAVTPTPYALGAVAALANSVTGTSIVDGSVQAGDLAAGAIGTAQINAAQVQRRVTGTCAGTQGVQSIGQDGTVVCGTFGGGGGTITGVTAGTGLTGGGTSGSVTLGIAAGGVGTAQINAAQVQARVTGTCDTGQYVRQVNVDGTVACGTDATGTAGWSLTGNAGTNPTTQFIGTTDAQPLVLRTSNARVWQAALAFVDFQGTGVNLVSGAPQNTTAAGFTGQTIAGGGTEFFPNQVQENFATVGGGRGNLSAADHATIAGGERNTASGRYSVAAGGLGNSAAGAWSAVGGGDQNCAGGSFSWAGGRFAKIRTGNFSGAPGLGCTGVPSSSDGDGDNGTFVWSDSQNPTFVSTGPNQFLVRAAGGMAINTNTPATGAALTVNGSVSTSGALNFGAQTRQMINLWGPTPTNSFYGIGVQGGAQYFRTDAGGAFAWFADGSHNDAQFNPGTGGSLLMSLSANGTTTTPTGVARAQSFVNVSDRAAKDGFSGVDPLDVLGKVVAMPMSRWFYRNAPQQWHIGPVAQDFFAAFGLGSDEKTISTVDADGVALAAIQGLNAKLESERDALSERVERLDAENAALRARLDAIEARLGGGR